jgi:TPR repeat protein
VEQSAYRFEKAAEQDILKAQHQAGVSYYEGRGVPTLRVSY